MSVGARFRRPRGVVAERFGDELLLLDPAGNRYYGLNATGAELYRALTTGATLREAADRLGRFPGAPGPGARLAEAQRTVRSLLARGLLAPADDDS